MDNLSVRGEYTAASILAEVAECGMLVFRPRTNQESALLPSLEALARVRGLTVFVEEFRLVLIDDNYWSEK